ncbi:S-layer homology domain-containing protein [Pelotomaculum terephthalicicum JT]|uniref:S-layer homology domain-containing protein n=1 Tax=Pelotomaculum terephthalicicum TaxID=206393 RepID=UPI001F04817D|nr:S-layer homology domain-containing protein [Pelotomaculum terephthalicicum]MCG9967282.1 S-layer homology domain-containing protein [Pelotomaculum terephthalicicum JT]
MQLRRLKLKAKAQKMVACLVMFVMLSLLWIAQPNPAGATDQSNDGYPAAQQLEVWVGYSGDASKTYTLLKTFQQSDLEDLPGQVENKKYTFIDNLPCPVLEVATGVRLTSILTACGIKADDVTNFRFWTSDVPNYPYQTLTKSFLLDTTRYYFPHIADNWENVESSFTDPTAGYTGDNEIYFPDSVAAAAYAVEVPTILAYEDHWQRLGHDGESGAGSSSLTADTRYRLVFGHPGNLASEHPIHTASKSAKWIYRMDVTLNKTLNSSSTVVTGVSLDKTSVTIGVGSTDQLTATITPSSAASQSVTWSSSDTKVATVDSTGLVTAVAPGTATITVTTADGGKTATCAVTVQAATAATGVTLNKTTATISVGATDQLTATIAPSSATNKSVTWSSSDPAVAAVDSNGKITAVAPGTATITVTTTDGGFTATCVVTVTDKSVPVFQNLPGDLNDISGHWAESNIKKLVALGVISGYPDGTFMPDSTITRAEFSVVLTKAFKLTLQDGKVFGDTAEHWANKYIATAAANGIVSGYDDNTFGPDDPITREQMAAMIVKAAKLSLTAEESEMQFADSESISDWARDALAIAAESGIINGYSDNSIQPQGFATRAEAVTAILNALNQ